MSQYILVCDDESYITRSISMKLTKAGYEVRTSSDGREALEAIQSDLPALLITDCQMPRMDGMELCRLLREDPCSENLPIILLSAKVYELEALELKTELRNSPIVPK
ncbi:MAG: response regulator, partial [Planctomycetes bacterium]|nr:response regulator [Planctomycetota bacterium]